ncbi:hypothetical protein I3760_14G124200 [Carya illinoinensis]|nr:hypothetical protein I3760_14G124200 [Carya illinoinensis]
MDSGEESDDDLGVGDGERSLPEEYSAFYKREVSKSEETNAKLELVKVSKVMAHLYDKMRYYITFEARDLADGGKTKTYQAVVRDAIPGISVLSFRLKPAEDEQVGSGNHGKEWIWEGHLVNGHLLAGG